MRAWARRVLGAAAHTDWLPGCLRIFLSRLGIFRRASTRAISALGHDSIVDPVSVTVRKQLISKYWILEGLITQTVTVEKLQDPLRQIRDKDEGQPTALDLIELPDNYLKVFLVFKWSTFEQLKGIPTESSISWLIAKVVLRQNRQFAIIQLSSNKMSE
ncbi:unnamed protein product [Schistocephalus solidus]|uniref:28S ribosomal protein S24, mitochondrial n=1 Tax=Schistocephalus solidus TaxID=70667 RepID=A0A183SFV0_SCHSO|nr:unnamed protein product [Schistocephalus solidus]